jgi:hypothetical protein
MWSGGASFDVSKSHIVRHAKTVGLLSTRDQPVAEAATYKTQQTSYMKNHPCLLPMNYITLNYKKTLACFGYRACHPQVTNTFSVMTWSVECKS